jgi:hypothetical protein
MNSQTQEIAVGQSTQSFGLSALVFQRHADGKLWRWDGKLACDGNGCPGWTLINTDRLIKEIAAGQDNLFMRQDNGAVWKWDGKSSCGAGGCPGWTLINTSPDTKEIVASLSTVFVRYDNGEVWEWDGKSPVQPRRVPRVEAFGSRSTYKSDCPFSFRSRTTS